MERLKSKTIRNFEEEKLNDSVNFKGGATDSKTLVPYMTFAGTENRTDFSSDLTSKTGKGYTPTI